MYPITFVSLGPGDPDLITLKALKTLQSVDCIFYPTTVSRNGQRSSRALDIMSEYNLAPSKLIPFLVPMSKERDLAIEAYKSIAMEAKHRYHQNEKIAIVAEGDAGFYSSIHYIYDYLIADNIAVDLIAGVPAFIACGALSGIHIVKQEEELNVIPGIISAEALAHKINNGKVIVVMKVSQCEEAVKAAIRQFPNSMFSYFENVGVTDREYFTQNKQEILDRKFPYFSIMIIHK